jgi:hypothetical protein
MAATSISAFSGLPGRKRSNSLPASACRTVTGRRKRRCNPREGNIKLTASYESKVDVGAPQRAPINGSDLKVRALDEAYAVPAVLLAFPRLPSAFNIGCQKSVVLGGFTKFPAQSGIDCIGRLRLESECKC